MDAGDAVVQTREVALGYYGQVWALALFLRTSPKYAPKVAEMLADAKAGRFHTALKMTPADLMRLRRRGRAYNRSVGQPLFEHYIAADLRAFEAEYRAFARKLAQLDS